MKKQLKVATILTWINLVFWGGLLGLMLLAALATGFFPLIVAIVLYSAIPLHAYAALQLYKSIRNPAVKLGNQTPTGIRFVGFVAQFFGILTVINGVIVIQDAATFAKTMQESFAQVKGGAQFVMYHSAIQGLGLFVTILGIILIVNVILNMRLLRWYYFIHQNDAGGASRD